MRTCVEALVIFVFLCEKRDKCVLLWAISVLIGPLIARLDLKGSCSTDGCFGLAWWELRCYKERVVLRLLLYACLIALKAQFTI
jgi:hypothetical protein